MYFLDTCAMLGYLKGEKKIERLVEEDSFSTSRFQLMELYYVSLREVGEDLAEKYYESFSKYEVDISEKTLKNAMKKRLELQKKNLNVSYVDAIGYQYSLENDMRFVTSDPAFKKLNKVVFIQFK